MIKRSFVLIFSLFSISAAAQEVIPIKDFLLGRFDYRNSSDFRKVEQQHSNKFLYLNTVAYNAFIEMFETAKLDDISLQIVSGTRNFDEQKIIWERKWKKRDSLNPSEKVLSILEFSAMPGTSRHHWGTDIDINSLENSYFEEGRGKAEYEWLMKNAAKFGFYQVYTPQTSGRTGYREEKWHWSYLPLAAKYLEDYMSQVSYEEIKGFEGDEYASEVAVIPQYVNGIPQELQYQAFVARETKKLVHIETSEGK